MKRAASTTAEVLFQTTAEYGFSNSRVLIPVRSADSEVLFQMKLGVFDTFGGHSTCV